MVLRWRLRRRARRARRRARTRMGSMAILTATGGTTEGVAELFALPSTVSPVDDPSRGTWVSDAVTGKPWATVRGNIPDHYEAYARILHPAFRHVTGTTGEPVRWADVAAMTGRTMHPLVQFERIAGLPDGHDQLSWGIRPTHGGVCDIAWPLIPILRSSTGTPERCVFGVWEGFGGMEMVPMIARAARIHCPDRTYAMFGGPVDGILAFCGRPWGPPGVWWSEERSWFVFTDIDLDSTYVGASRACIDAILGEPALEAFPATIDDRIDIGADEINPPFPRP